MLFLILFSFLVFVLFLACCYVLFTILQKLNNIFMYYFFN